MTTDKHEESYYYCSRNCNVASDDPKAGPGPCLIHIFIRKISILEGLAFRRLFLAVFTRLSALACAP